MSTLTLPKGTFHSFFFNKTLHISYWGIDEWIWILTLIIWPIWKNGRFSTEHPNSARWGEVVPHLPQWLSWDSGHSWEQKPFLGRDPFLARRVLEDICIGQTFHTPHPWCLQEQPSQETPYVGLALVSESKLWASWKKEVGGCLRSIGTLFLRNGSKKLFCLWAVGHLLS